MNTLAEVTAEEERSLARRVWRRATMSRWTRRLGFAARRFSKALKVLEVRLVRKPLVRLLYASRDVAPPPCMATLRLTSGCNLRCIQCGQWGEHGAFLRPNRPTFPKEMTTSEWKRLLARLTAFCPHLYFFGGEPFLRKDCLELVRYASTRGAITGVNTNANFLEGRGPEIVESGMDYLIVSLDGPKEVNNRIRVAVGPLDVYEKVLAGIAEVVRARRARQSPYPLLEMYMTLTTENQAHILETAQIALGLGIDYFAVTFGIFTTPELAEESTRAFQEDFGVEPHFYRAFVRDVAAMDPPLIEQQLAEVRRLWGSRYKQYPPVAFDAAQYYREVTKPLVRWPCIAPWVTMQIMPNGDMVFCEDFPDLTVGNVRDQDPLKLWNNEVSRAWRRRIRTKGIYPAETRCADYYLQ